VFQRPKIEVDEDVQMVAAVMMANIPTARSVAVAKAVDAIAPTLREALSSRADRRFTVDRVAYFGR